MSSWSFKYLHYRGVFSIGLEDIESVTRSVTPPPNYDSPEVAIEFRDEKDICPRLSGRLCFIVIVVTIVILVAVGLGVGLNHAHHLGPGSTDALFQDPSQRTVFVRLFLIRKAFQEMCRKRISLFCDVESTRNRIR